MKLKSQNQRYPPQKKSKRVDKQGNVYKRLIAKDGGASIIIMEHMTENAYTKLMNDIEDFVTKCGGKIKVQFKTIL